MYRRTTKLCKKAAIKKTLTYTEKTTNAKTSEKKGDRTSETPTDKSAPQINPEKKRTRKRNVTWFNPPYSQNVATNIGKKFFALLKSCFPPDNKLHKIINKNTIKLSYSCMTNVKNIIDSHNKNILNQKPENNNTDKKCNCRHNECGSNKFLL